MPIRTPAAVNPPGPSSTAPSSLMAPELDVSQWFNTSTDISLAKLRGEVVVIEAFQMLCPGCVSHGIPQAQRVQQVFGADLTVLGLHSVFEHHQAMQPVSLEAFLHEYRITFPVGVDRHESGSDLPVTMRNYRLRGTPSMVVIDRVGRIRINEFGQSDDLLLGAALGRLLAEDIEPDCDPTIGCPAPATSATPTTTADEPAT